MRVLLIDRGSGLVELLAPYDPDLVAELKARVPYRSRTWDPETKSWRIAPQFTETIVGAIRTLGFDVERLAPKGSTGSASQTGRSTPDPDLAVLYLLPDAPKEVVQAAFRALALLYHPNRAGYEATPTMQRINAAFDNVKRKRGWT